MWLRYLETKNKLATRLQRRMSEYLLKNCKSKKIPLATQRGMKTRNSVLNVGDRSRFRLRMYFESTCPHCKRMMETLNTLQNNGHFVEALQLDKAPLFQAAFPLRISRANTLDTKKHNITSVPFLLIADLKNKVISEPIKGFQSPKQIENILLLMKDKN